MSLNFFRARVGPEECLKSNIVPTTDRISACFSRLKLAATSGLVTYIPVGYPSLAETPGLVAALIEGGACIVELGVPFSDPLADGATIQRATHQALLNGVTLKDCLQVASTARARFPDVPLVFMGYYNSFLQYGLEAICDDAIRAGVDGFIVIDLPPEEAELFSSHCKRVGASLIFLLAPTSTEERIEKVAALASGFVYCVSVTGVTGARTALPPDLSDFVNRVRKHIRIPIAVGFGVSQREHVLAISKVADAVVVGSALVDVVEQSDANGRAEKLRAYVHELVG